MVLLSVEQVEKAKNDGLYATHLEKDSCGVGFVTSIRGNATHQILRNRRTMLERLVHCEACACDSDSGDGAGVMTAIPDALYRKAIEAFTDLAKGCNLTVIAWLKLETNPEKVGHRTLPPDKELFQRNVYLLRKQAETQLAKQKIECYVVSLSSSIIIYKLYQYYSDPTNPEYESYMAMVYIAHNGVINTLSGNINLMHAREGLMKSHAYGSNLQLYSCKNWLQNIRSAITMVPEDWKTLMTFSDERYFGAIVDGSGSRPARFYITKDEHIFLASEVGIADLAEINICSAVIKYYDPFKYQSQLMICCRVFMKYSRETVFYQPAEERMKTWNEITDCGTIRSNIRMEFRCMDCGVPFCQGNTGCPLGNIPKWNDYVSKQNWRQALEQLLQANNFPEFTGHVCPASSRCLVINSLPVTIKSIECWMKPYKPNYSTDKRIAIIGSGPNRFSGLAAAAQLNKVGHAVSYTRKRIMLVAYMHSNDEIRYVVDIRVRLLEDEDIRFITNTEIGKHVPADSCLRSFFNAILICTGSLIPRDFSTANREAKEICFAMEFLEKSQRIVSDKEDIWEGLNAKGKQVIVLGGGDTATDCTATCARLGAQSVQVLETTSEPPDERYPDNPWPIIFRTDYGHEERKGITSDDPRLFGFATKKFLVSKSGSGQKILTGLLMIRVDWKKDENGAWRISEIEDSEEEMSCDLCILAMGFLGPEKVAIYDLTFSLQKIDVIRCNTAKSKIYVAGDGRRDQSLVVRIDHDLMGKTTLAGPGGVVLAPVQN
uniref:Glutamine amidotransferase type-2 domain-containing protein n=1 Tax=Onchocerca volvulus TaxID=6282 RepID=A0A8R1TVL0_ONCVO